MQIGKLQFTLEVADNAASQTKGLMERDSMPEHHGMIFVFPDEREHNFYMKNTRFALDILFVNQAGTIISTATMQPYDLTLVPSHGLAKYAIEVNAGMVVQAGVRVGDQLTIPPAVDRAPTP